MKDTKSTCQCSSMQVLEKLLISHLVLTLMVLKVSLLSCTLTMSILVSYTNMLLLLQSSLHFLLPSLVIPMLQAFYWFLMTIMIVLLCHLMVMLMDGLSSNPLMDRIQSFSKSLIMVVLRIVYHYRKTSQNV